MKKMSVCLMMVGLMAFGAFGADLQDARLATTAAVTTNTLSGTIGAAGEVKLMVIDVSNANPISVTITETTTGATLYSNAALAADVTLIPRLPVTLSTGATVPSGTNIIYAAVNCLGLNYSITASSNTANTVSIKVITDKNP
jgi:hypothetical protein